jgi:hypothetical protein
LSEEWGDDQTWIRPLSKIEYGADGTLRVWNREDDTWTEYESFAAYQRHLEARTRELLGGEFMDQLGQ